VKAYPHVARKTARAIDRDAEVFYEWRCGIGVVEGTVERSAWRGGRLALLCVPSFIARFAALSEQ
jgi:hypothetical protein